MDPGVEAVVEPDQGRSRVHVPLADEGRLITPVLQAFRQGWSGQMDALLDRVFGQARPGIRPAFRGVIERVYAGAAVLPTQQAGARRHTDRIVRHGMLEPDALPRQAIDVRGANDVVAVTADLGRPQLVAQAENDIRLWRPLPRSHHR